MNPKNEQREIVGRRVPCRGNSLLGGSEGSTGGLEELRVVEGGSSTECWGQLVSCLQGGQGLDRKRE